MRRPWRRALGIWRTINKPNLTENVVPNRGRADLVLRKDGQHSVHSVLLRQGVSCCARSDAPLATGQTHRFPRNVPLRTRFEGIANSRSGARRQDTRGAVERQRHRGQPRAGPRGGHRRTDAPGGSHERQIPRKRAADETFPRNRERAPPTRRGLPRERAADTYPGIRRGQSPTRSRTTVDRRSAIVDAVSSDGASTMTRTTGSVPEGRSSTRPVSPSSSRRLRSRRRPRGRWWPWPCRRSSR